MVYCITLRARNATQRAQDGRSQIIAIRQRAASRQDARRIATERAAGAWDIVRVERVR